MSDILEMIDNAITDYEMSDDAMRWTPEPPPPPQTVKLPIVPAEITPEQVEMLRAAFRELGRRLAERTAPMVEVFARLNRELHAAGVIPPPPPGEPMQRAIEARRNRNTGPQQRQRAPRRIDPRVHQ